jgi:hypothetical protein
VRRFGPRVAVPLLYVPILMRHLNWRNAVIWHNQSKEPSHTIYLDRWREGVTRLRGLTGEPRRLFTELLGHVDAGWKHVRELQLACETLARAGTQNMALRDVLAFIDADVVDTYRELAFDAADLVPGWAGWAQVADPGNLDGDASLFTRYLGVLRLAAASDELPQHLRDVSNGTWTGMQGWGPRFEQLLRAIDETVILPSLSSAEPDAERPRFSATGEDSSIG